MGRRNLSIRTTSGDLWGVFMGAATARLFELSTWRGNGGRKGRKAGRGGGPGGGGSESHARI